MAGVSSEQGSNKLDVELNLVPFIDLLSSLVLFLLLTAVWLQVSVVPASVDSKGKSTVAAVDRPKLTVRVSPAGYSLEWPGAFQGKRLPTLVPRKNGAYDPMGLAAVIRVAAKSATLPMSTVSGDDTVPYGAVVQAVDAIKAEGGQAVALSTE